MDLLTIGKRVKDIRINKLKLTQEDFAKKLNLDRAYLSRLECGKQNITIEMLITICEDGLGVSLKEFFDF